MRPRLRPLRGGAPSWASQGRPGRTWGSAPPPPHTSPGQRESRTGGQGSGTEGPEGKGGREAGGPGGLAAPLALGAMPAAYVRADCRRQAPARRAPPVAPAARTSPGWKQGVAMVAPRWAGGGGRAGSVPKTPRQNCHCGAGAAGRGAGLGQGRDLGLPLKPRSPAPRDRKGTGCDSGRTGSAQHSARRGC